MSQRLRQYKTRANTRNRESSDSEDAHDVEQPLTKAQKAARTRQANKEAARRKEEEAVAQTKGKNGLVPRCPY